jgi:hypothetical protein
MGSGTNYSLAGLTVVSDVELPELLPGSGAAPDVTIRLSGRLPEVADLQELGAGWWAGPAAVRIEVAGVARFHVQEGSRILVDVAPGAAAADVRLYLLGSAFGALLHQRSLLPLHAAGIVLDNGCFAIGGDSGAGKSTLSAFIRQRGYRSLADDVLAVERRAAGALALPGYPQTKLWADTARALGLEAGGRARVDGTRDKYYFDIDRNAAFCGEARPLRRFYVLCEAETVPSITRVGSAEALTLLTANTYRPFLLQPMGRWASHFAACAELLCGIEVYRLGRRRELAEMDVVVDLLLAHAGEASTKEAYVA